jgi:Bacterial Ig-like domain (group 2)
MSPAVRAAGLLLPVLLAACAGDGPVAPAPAAEVQAVTLARLECAAVPAQGTLRCDPAAPAAGDARGLIIGGQGINVQLTASGHTSRPAESYFAMNVTVRNLMGQALGTADGTTPHVDGVRIFFDEEPYPSAGNLLATIALGGAVERAFILRPEQAFYRYAQVLAPDSTSAPVLWEMSVPAGVTAFRFSVYVQAVVRYPRGWIDVSASADTVLAGTVVTLADSVRNVLGDALPAEAVAWSTSDPLVATVSAAGTVTAVGPGTATLTATSGPRTGTARIAVCPALAVGGAYTAAMPAASAVCLAGGAAGAEYVYVPVNLDRAAPLGLEVAAAGVVAAAGPPSPALLPASPLRLRDGGPAADDEGHARRMERQVEELRALRPARIGRGGGPRLLITPGVPAVGALMTLNVAGGCSGARDDRAGRVVSVGRRVVVVADTANPAGGFGTAQYDSMAAEFDSLAWPVDSAAFGVPTDLDGNGRVVALFTRAVNERTPVGASSVTLGSMEARDLFTSGAGGCPRSNEGEIFYLLVPDPAGTVNGNTRSMGFVRRNTLGTMAHELQHLANASRRIYLNGAWSGLYEETWLNEGLSHVAEELMFYRAAGLAPRANLDHAALATGPQAARRSAAFTNYLTQNFGRLRLFMERPDTAGPVKPGSVLAIRGATWAFLRYAADRHGGDETALWQALANTQKQGMANLLAALGTDATPWVRDFSAALYVDDAVAGVNGAYGIASWNLRSVYAGTTGFPLLARPLASGAPLGLTYARGGGTAFLRMGVAAGGFAGVTALSAGAPPHTPCGLVIIRTK